MSERRRFFPATPVQRVPGRTVELEMQLRPEAPVAPAQAPAEPPPAGGCELFGVGWFIDTSTIGWNHSVSVLSETLADGRTHFWDDGFKAQHMYWQGSPEHVGGWGRPIPEPGFHCTELRLWRAGPGFPMVFYGMLQGASMTAVRWELSWDAPMAENPGVSEFGDFAYTWGNVLCVQLVEDGGGGLPAVELTATAFCAEQAVGTLILGWERPGW